MVRRGERERGPVAWPLMKPPTPRSAAISVGGYRTFLACWHEARIKAGPAAEAMKAVERGNLPGRDDGERFSTEPSSNAGVASCFASRVGATKCPKPSLTRPSR